MSAQNGYLLTTLPTFRKSVVDQLGGVATDHMVAGWRIDVNRPLTASSRLATIGHFRLVGGVSVISESFSDMPDEMRDRWFAARKGVAVSGPCGQSELSLSGASRERGEPVDVIAALFTPHRRGRRFSLLRRSASGVSRRRRCPRAATAGRCAGAGTAPSSRAFRRRSWPEPAYRCRTRRGGPVVSAAVVRRQLPIVP